MWKADDAQDEKDGRRASGVVYGAVTVRASLSEVVNGLDKGSVTQITKREKEKGEGKRMKRMRDKDEDEPQLGIERENRRKRKERVKEGNSPAKNEDTILPRRTAPAPLLNFDVQYGGVFVGGALAWGSRAVTVSNKVTILVAARGNLGESLLVSKYVRERVDDGGSMEVSVGAIADAGARGNTNV
ncbi:hypothetical protein BDQ17DRAFT_1328668 [Cyathus striatus]|nr:hypothetical protein BDQ17DRAFT_1328668 [Cyathus striatus]